MYWYKIYGMIVESEFYFPELKQIDEQTKADVTIKKGKGEASAVFSTKPEICEEDYLYTCHNKFAAVNRGDDANFTIENGNEIVYYLYKGYDRERVKQALIFMCMLIVRVQLGLITLHGSCVVLDGKAYIVTGDSGAGKSTFTTELLLHKDAKFLSDDACAITLKEGQCIVEPSIPERKLCNNTAIQYGYELSDLKKMNQLEGDKYILDQSDKYMDQGVPLAGIVVIEPKECEEVTVKEIEGSDRFAIIMDCVFHTNMYLLIQNAKEMFEQCNQIVKTIPMYRLERPKDRSSESEMLDAFEELITNETIVS